MLLTFVTCRLLSSDQPRDMSSALVPPATRHSCLIVFSGRELVQRLKIYSITRKSKHRHFLKIRKIEWLFHELLITKSI